MRGYQPQITVAISHYYKEWLLLCLLGGTTRALSAPPPTNPALFLYTLSTTC